MITEIDRVRPGPTSTHRKWVSYTFAMSYPQPAPATLSPFRLAAIFSLLLSSACGGSTSSEPGADADVSGDGDGDADGGGDGDGYQPLVTGSWSIPAGDEGYWCVRKTVTEDTYITGFRAISPVGTHHTVLTVGTAAGADGEFPCGPGTNDDAMLFASGVGTDPYDLPEGVGIKVSAGQQLLLNLHLFNISDQTLTGSSGTEILTTSADGVDHLAEMVFAGTIDFAIPDDGMPYSASGSCQFDQDATLISLWPHMHQLGTHMVIKHGDSVLHDKPYSFDEQRAHVIEPVEVKAGEQLDVTCTWVNDGEDPVTFGDSSTSEMCFAGFYRYPAANAGLFCDVF